MSDEKNTSQTETDQVAGVAAESQTAPAAEAEAAEAPSQEALEGDQLLMELIGSAQARASLYKLVSLLFSSKPVGPLVESLAQSINADAPIDNPIMKNGFKQMAEFLAPQRTNATLLDLIVDYTLSVDKVDFGEKNAIGAPKDQLGATCESLCMLCNRQAETLKEGDLAEGLKMLEIQQNLYQERLAEIAEKFCDSVDQTACTLFYKGASQLVRGFSQDESMFIEDSIAAVKELIAAKDAKEQAAE